MVPLRPEELLLSGHAEELPDLPVRRADRLRRLDRGRGGRRDVPDRHRAGPHGGGHRQVAARRRRDRADPRRRPFAARLQPLRRTADRDRDQAHRGHRGQGARGGAGVRGDAAGTAPGARRLGRPDGAGVVALRRERVAAAGRQCTAWHPDRDQERQLAAQRRAGRALRDHPAGGDPGRRRVDQAGDPALAGGLRHHEPGPQQGDGGGLPLLPRARPGAGGADAGSGSSSCAARCRSRRSSGRSG